MQGVRGRLQTHSVGQQWLRAVKEETQSLPVPWPCSMAKGVWALRSPVPKGILAVKYLSQQLSPCLGQLNSECNVAFAPSVHGLPLLEMMQSPQQVLLMRF